MDSNDRFFGPCNTQIWWMTSKNNRAPLLYYIKLCASFQTHWWIQTAVTVQKRSIWVKIGNLLSWVTLKFDGWPWQKIRHLFYATSSFVNHFKAIGEFKLEWQSGNAQFHSKSAIFFPCDLEISRMTLKNNRAPLLCHFKIWASFHSHLWIPTGVTVRKIPILGQNQYFLALWPWNLMDNLEKQKGTSSMLLQSLCIISQPSLNSNWRYNLETPNLGRNQFFFSRVTLQFDRWPWKLIGHCS